MTVSTRDGRSLALRLAQGLELLELALERELAVVEGDVVQHAALAQLEAERELGQLVGLADAVVGEADRPALLRAVWPLPFRIRPRRTGWSDRA